MTKDKLNWTEMLIGRMFEAYRAFHSYSICNQASQLTNRGLRVSPLSTFNGWQAKGRKIRKGEKAISLWMPLTFHSKDEDNDDKQKTITRFAFKNNWFALSQTDGKDYELPPMPAWNKEQALTNLQVEEISFDMADGNCQGYATQNKLAINPLAQLPHKTLFHELGHIMLGHTKSDHVEADRHELVRNIKEVEAESVAMILCEVLDLPGVEYTRGYIQDWLKSDKIPEASAKAIMSAASKILKAGQ
jgi:antirestriction protein ArdC